MTNSSSGISDSTSATTAIARWRVILIAGIAALTGLAAISAWMTVSTPIPLPPKVSPHEYELARETFELKNGRRAEHSDVLYSLAEHQLARKRLADAVDCFAAIRTSDPTWGRMARYRQGITLVDLYRATEAEQQLREVISLEETLPELQPEDVIRARQRLRHILEVEVRLEERHQLLRGVIDRSEDSTFEPVAGCFPTLVRWSGPDAIQWVEHFQAADPESVVLNIALGRYRTVQGRPEEGRQILQAVVRKNPTNLSALAALLACLREADAPEELARILESLPPRTPDDPWLLLLQRGLAANQAGDAQEAAVAFEQLIQQDRTCTEAWQGLGQAARRLGDIPRSKKALEMTAGLGLIQSQLGKAVQESSDPNSFLDIADRCAEISLNREGAVMARCALRLAPQNERVRAAVSLFRERLAADHERPLLGN